MRVNPFWMPLVAIVLLLGTVSAAQLAGVWTTSGRTAVNPGTLTPDDLKGWMTLQQVIEGLELDQAQVYALGNIPNEVPPSTALKDLEGVIPGFELTTLRNALNAKLSAPAPTEPAAADKTPTPVEIVTPSSVIHGSPTPLPAGQVLPADQVKGRMSLREVSDQCAVPLDQLLAALELSPETNPDTLLKDLVAEGQISEITSVQQAVGGLQK